MRTGVQLGPYAIIARLGAGGMGEVYRATDTRLDRAVAIKILKPHGPQNPRAVQRFQREARAVSKVNHPHICALYDIGEQDGVQFIVMEYIEGETLAQRLTRGALPLDLVLRLSIEIADALDHAHRHGIVHRDLKPANIMLTRAGTKLLDFGIAALSTPGTMDPDTPQARRGAETLTEEGSILGTLQYMAPEQLEARATDARADIFAFGAIVYEMATGHQAFTGTSRASIIAAVLDREPELLLAARHQAEPVTSSPSNPRLAMPWQLDQIVARCLSKNPDERFQTAADLGQALRWAAERGLQKETTSLQARSHRWPISRLAWIGGGLLATVTALIAGITLVSNGASSESSNAQQYRFNITPPPNSAFSASSASLALSPDGRRLAFTGSTEQSGLELWIQPLDSVDARKLTGAAAAGQLFWSSDSRTIAFADTASDFRLKTIDVDSGAVRFRGVAQIEQVGTWHSGHGILAKVGDVITTIPLEGGTPASVTSLDASRGESSHRFPSFLPDGRHFVYLATSTQAEHDGIAYLMETGGRTPLALFESDSQVVYAAPGYLVYMIGNTLLARPFDAGSLRVTGEPIPIAEQVERNTSSRRGAFTVSQTGVLAYRRPTESQLVWFHRDGRRLDTVGRPGHYLNPALSPDGTRVAVSQLDLKTGSWDIWLIEVATGRTSRFTLHEANDDAPVWSLDGSRIAFKSDRTGEVRFYWKPADGSGPEELLLAPPSEGRRHDRTLYAWLNDGALIFGASGRTAGRHLWRASFGMNGTVTPVGQTPFAEAFCAVSPDSRWLAYASNEAGRFEVYAAPYPSAHVKWPVSVGGGTEPAWRGDGEELFYLAPKGQLMAVPIKAGTSLEFGAPQPLFQTALSSLVNPNYTRNQYAVSGDGQRILIHQPAGKPSLAVVTVVVGWPAALKGRSGS